MKILVYGDSISDGYWDFKKGGWVARLRLLFWKKYSYDNAVYNFGISGDTSREVNINFTPFLKSICKREHIQNDATVLCMIGINDCARDISTGEYQVGPEEFKSNLEKISLKIKRESLVKNVMFISNINVYEKKANKVAEEYYNYNEDIELYNTLIKDFTERKGYLFIDIYGKMRKSNLKFDGTHPNAAGHKKIYKIVKKYLINNILHNSNIN